MRSAIFSLLAIVAAATPALAETLTERSACTPDVLRLCASHIPDVGAITGCLRAKHASLSRACRVVIDTSDTSIRTAARRR